MEEKKIYTEAEIEELAERASQNAMEHFKHGLNCGECVLQGFLDLGISGNPPGPPRLPSLPFQPTQLQCHYGTAAPGLY